MAQDLFSGKSVVNKSNKQTIHGRNRVIYVNRIVLEMNQQTNAFMFNVDFKLSYLRDAHGDYINAPFQGFHVIDRYNAGAQRANHYQIITHEQFKHLCDVCDVTAPDNAILDQRWKAAQEDRTQTVLYDYDTQRAQFVFEGTVVQDPQALSDHSGEVHPELAGWVNMKTIAKLGTHIHTAAPYQSDLENSEIQGALSQMQEQNNKEKTEKKAKSYQTQVNQENDDLDR